MIKEKTLDIIASYGDSVGEKDLIDLQYILTDPLISDSMTLGFLNVDPADNIDFNLTRDIPLGKESIAHEIIAENGLNEISGFVVEESNLDELLFTPTPGSYERTVAFLKKKNIPIDGEFHQIGTSGRRL